MQFRRDLYKLFDRSLGNQYIVGTFKCSEEALSCGVYLRHTTTTLLVALSAGINTNRCGSSLSLFLMSTSAGDESSPPIEHQNKTKHKTNGKLKDGAQIDTPPSPKHEESDDACLTILNSQCTLTLLHRKKTKQKEIEAKKKAEVELETAKKRQSSKKKAKKLGSNKKTSSLQTDNNKSRDLLVIT
ncbi:hypothetical protein AM593_02642, partial [Mytilus galloprovincialis]